MWRDDLTAGIASPAVFGDILAAPRIETMRLTAEQLRDEA
jgi:hypothetical protein